ncbi:MAG: hypothetical protein QME96_07540 [Myxococcota bacterium]|nr:hypothetical protein [Myxococcota bacterium]
MIRLTGMLHEAAFREILDRWLIGRFSPDDCATLKRIVNFNAYADRVYLDEFAAAMLGALVDRPTFSFPATRKGTLKDFIVRSVPCRSARAEAMISHYTRFPEDYYRETPFEGRIYAVGDGNSSTYVMSSRVKRMRRIAEKGARRIIDHIFAEIKRRADDLAAERAAHLGVPKDRLVTSPEEQIAEFAHAERRLIKAIRSGTFLEGQPDLVIHDVTGVKVITDIVPIDRLREWFDRDPRIEVMEEEPHEGRYNAVNFLLRYRLDKERLVERAPDGRGSAILVSRGVAAPGSLPDSYASFVRSAEDTVVIEMIAAGYEEMLESEIGRSMHENRIIEQRRQQEYRGHLAKNIEYLVEFALAFALSPMRTLEGQPLRVWVKYMPDTFDDMLKSLWGIPASASIPCGEPEVQRGLPAAGVIEPAWNGGTT